jgi:hypothetical protein
MLAQGKNTRDYLKNNLIAKTAGDVAQVVECLPGEHGAMSSKCSAAKTNL